MPVWNYRITVDEETAAAPGNLKLAIGTPFDTLNPDFGEVPWGAHAFDQTTCVTPDGLPTGFAFE